MNFAFSLPRFKRGFLEEFGSPKMHLKNLVFHAMSPVVSEETLSLLHSYFKNVIGFKGEWST